ncbi:MAG: hypothetical protein ACREU9_10750 [Gammaproteobacteria bacterium]
MRPTKTKAVAPSTSGVVHVFVNAEGEYKLEREHDAPDLSVEMSDGRILGLYEFMDAIAKYWRGYLLVQGVAVVPQAQAELYGTET